MLNDFNQSKKHEISKVCKEATHNVAQRSDQFSSEKFEQKFQLHSELYLRRLSNPAGFIVCLFFSIIVLSCFDWLIVFLPP